MYNLNIDSVKVLVAINDKNESWRNPLVRLYYATILIIIGAIN